MLKRVQNDAGAQKKPLRIGAALPQRKLLFVPVFFIVSALAYDVDFPRLFYGAFRWL